MSPSSNTALGGDLRVDRDLLSDSEELIEMAFAAYIERTGDRGLPEFRSATIAMARDEIEGGTSSAFHSGFVGELASAARGEIDRQAEAERAREQGRARD